MRALVPSLAVLIALSRPAVSPAQTVGQVAARRACSTAGVVALTAQLIETQRCMNPNALVRVTPHRNVVLTARRINPFMQAGARDALWTASRAVTLRVNSLFRTLADQYVLYHSRACPLAAEPGESNHETGTAVDLDNWRAAQRAMTAAGCRHTYPGRDDVHFDCTGRDRRADSVRAFQRLWNLNHPEDHIPEDGEYGAGTAQRVARSPARGFARHGCAQVARVDAGVTPPDAGAHEPDAGSHPRHHRHDAGVDAGFDSGIPALDAAPELTPDATADDMALTDASIDLGVTTPRPLDATMPAPARHRGCACGVTEAPRAKGVGVWWLAAVALAARRAYRRRR